MRIHPPTPALVELFGRLLPPTGGDARTMFGCPCGFLGGNLFMGLFEDKLFVRLAEADRARLLAEEGAEQFDPMGGRPMREYVVVPAAWLEGDDDRRLADWVAKAARYGRSLPPKARKPARKPAAKKPAANKRRR
jgi:TfoX/Sxy family transcriptional regulator of competence genes